MSPKQFRVGRSKTDENENENENENEKGDSMKVQDCKNLCKPVFGLKKKKRLQKESGLTLIEIIIVLGLVGGLIALLAGRLVGGLDRAKVKQSKVGMSTVVQALQGYQLDCGSYPEDLGALINDPGDTCRDWAGPYLKEDNIKDAWGTDYVLEQADGQVVIKSFGADKKPGGTGFAKDLEEGI